MVLAETISIDGGVLVLILAVLLLVLLGTAAVVVTGLVAGVRSGRDPSRSRSTAVWAVCLSLESTLLVLALASTEMVWVAPAALVVAATAAARWVGRRRRP